MQAIVLWIAMLNSNNKTLSKKHKIHSIQNIYIYIVYRNMA